MCVVVFWVVLVGVTVGRDGRFGERRVGWLERAAVGDGDGLGGNVAGGRGVVLDAADWRDARRGGSGV